LEQRRSPGTAMNRGFSLFQGEVAMHHLKKLPACLDRSPKLPISEAA
jgi:hypothetical protein